MKYNIAIEIPDDLINLAKLLSRPGVAEVREELHLQAVSAEQSKTLVTLDQLQQAAMAASKTPEGLDAGRKALAALGYRKLKDVPEEHWDALLETFHRIAEQGR